MSAMRLRSIFSRALRASQGTVPRKTEENISEAEMIIAKWDPEKSAYAKITSIFHEGRDKAQLFLRAVADLQRSMNTIMANSVSSNDEILVKCQNLMKVAIRRLQKEFYQILSSNRDRLDPESLTHHSASSLSDLEDDEIHAAKDSIDEVEGISLQVMNDLRSIAESMISCGYAKECVKVYTTIRRSIVDEGLYKLGFDRLSPSKVQKLDWDALDTRVQNWIAASKVAVRTLFAGERALCDYIFSSSSSSSSSIHESSFAKIARDPAIYFFGFPELVSRKTKKSPERVFRMLDMHDSLTGLLPEIESVFSHDSVSAVRSQVTFSLLNLADSVRSLISDFETAIQKEVSKGTVLGGGLHPLTRYVMNYLVFLADYSDALRDIYADQPFVMPASLPEPVFEAMAAASSVATSAASSPVYGPQESDLSSVSPRFAWLILDLLCKLDGKAESYREVPLAYLFLANNLQYVLNKVRGSQLKDILGDAWVFKHESRARRYAGSYERLAWGKVLAAAALTDAEAAGEAVILFEKVFTEACREQAAWIVPDRKMRDELKLSVARKLIPAYKSLYQAAVAQLRGEKDSSFVPHFTPDDLGNYISDLFFGDASTNGSSSASLSGSLRGSSPASMTPRSRLN